MYFFFFRTGYLIVELTVFLLALHSSFNERRRALCAYQFSWLCFCIRYTQRAHANTKLSIFSFQRSDRFHIFHTQKFGRTTPIPRLRIQYVALRVENRQAIRSDGRESIGGGLNAVNTLFSSTLGTPCGSTTRTLNLGLTGKLLEQLFRFYEIAGSGYLYPL